MKKLILLPLLICFSLLNAQENFAFENDFLSIQSPAVADNFANEFKVVDNLMFVGARYDDDQALNNGSVSIYDRVNSTSPWIFVKKIYPTDIKIDAYFGEGLAFNGDLLVVGAAGWGPNTSNKHGTIYIFSRNEGGLNNWGQIKKINPSTLANNANFGISVDIDGDNIIVGAPGQKRAYIYEKDLGGLNNWGERKILTDASTRTFGVDVAIKDGLAFMGGTWLASGYSSNFGRVNIYSQNTGGANNWGLIKFLEQAVNTFGVDFDFDGTTLAVNSPRYYGTGASVNEGKCYIFYKDQGGINNFGLVKTINPIDITLVDQFGKGISVDGSNLVIGAKDDNLGNKAYYFQKNLGGTDNWGAVGVFLNSDRSTTDNFGYAIDINDKEVYVGAELADLAVNLESGKLYAFHLDSCFNKYTILNDSILYESTYFFDEQFLNKDGQYLDTLQTSAGCDSILILNLYVKSRISFADKWDFASADGPYDVAIGDLTGDGKNDMVSANYLGNSISLFWNIGSPGVLNPSTFFPSVTVPVGNRITGVEIADISGDGVKDIIVSSYNNDSIYVFKNIHTSGQLTAASFAAPVSYLAGNGPFEIETEDLDGNGKVDVIVINKLDKSVSVFANFSFSNTVFLAPKLDYSLGFETGNNLAFGDLNNDGKKEILVTVTGSDVLYAFQNNGVVGGISFLPYTVMTLNGGNPGSAQIYDFNNDGCNDIFQSSYISGFKASTYQYNCTAGNLNRLNFTHNAFYDFGPLVTSSLYGLQTRMSDLDLNGKSDVVFNSRPSGTINGKLFAFANINNFDNTLTADDFNTKAFKLYTTNYTNLPLNTSSSFDYAINLRLGDLDGDGLDDLAVINFGDDKIMVFKNTSIQSTIQTDTLASVSLNGSTFCTGDSIELAIQTNASMLPGNQYVVQLSDALGSFASTNVLATIYSASTSSLKVQIPNSTTQGSAYRIRLISSQPYIVGDSSAAFSIQNSSINNITASICSGDSFLFDNQYLSSPGIYIDTLQNSISCDSIIILTLNAASLQQYTFNDTICQGDTLIFGSQLLVNTGTYTDTLPSSSACDSLITLNLFLIQASNSTQNASICQGGSFTFGTQTLTTAGTYQRTMPNAAGCDSVLTLNLTVNANTSSTQNESICQGASFTFGTQTLTTAGIYQRTIPNAAGCDSVIILNLTVNANSSSTQSAAICQGASFTFGTQTLTTAGTYQRTMPNAAGCDSVITINLTVNANTSSTQNASICQGASFTFGTQTLTSAGTYQRTIPNAAGCDSVLTLNLTVNANSSSMQNASICQGASFTFGTQTLTTAGTYQRTITNAAGCDSVLTLNLTVNANSSSTQNASICQGSSFTFGTQTLTTAGTYQRTIPNAAGCDSVLTLNLTVNANSSSTQNASICQGGSFTFGTQTLTTAGTYQRTMPNAAGCDSVLTLNLTVNANTNSTQNAAICQGASFTFGTQTLTTAGTYQRIIPNAAGCDSVLTLNLTVNANSSSTQNASICQGASFTFGTQTLTTAGTYQRIIPNAAGCDSVLTLNLTVNANSSSTQNASICQGSSFTFGTQTLTTAGTYQRTILNAAGCDSVLILNLAVNANSSSTQNASICQGASFTFGTQTLTTAGTYQRTIPNAAGCDSVLTLNLTVNANTSSTQNASICQGASFTFGTQTLTTAGTYQRTIPNAAGCDSVITLNLTVNANSSSTQNAAICQGGSFTFGTQTLTTAGTYQRTIPNAAGCDSILTLNLTVNANSSSTQNASICQGASFSFGTQTLTTAGTYQRTIPNAAGCDSLITLNLTVNANSSSTQNAAICQGASFTFGTQTLTTAGTYQRTIPNALGCDSVLTLNLSVNANTSSTQNASICQGASFTFGTQTLTSAGTYQRTIPNAVGCDSVITLNLTVNANTSSTQNASICQGASFTFGTQTLTTAGTYQRTIPNAAGCDSVITLNLAVNANTSSTQNASICQGASFTFGTQTLTTAGTYQRTIPNAAGCDSVLTLNLTVNANTSSTQNAAICQGGSFTFGTQTLTSAGTYQRTIPNAAGCDSVLTLNLSVNANTSSTQNASICQGASFTFGTQTLTTAGTYQRTIPNAAGCDSVLTLNLTVNANTSSTQNAAICQGASFTFGTQTLTTAGTYQRTMPNAAGCDSVITLNLTVNANTSSTQNASICQGASFTFGTQTLTTAGTYQRTILNAAGCDSLITLNLTVNANSSSTQNASICQGASFAFGTQTLTTAGTYQRTMPNAAGCDSVITLNLTVNANTSSTQNASICQGASFTFGTQTLTTAGTYQRTILNAVGCDSVLTLNLTVNANTNSTQNASICQGASFTFGTQTLTTAGTYQRTIPNAAGCDSVLTLNLSVNANTSSTQNASICQGGSFAFGTQTLTTAGTYQRTILNAAGCDSVITLNLTVNANTNSTQNASICQGASFTFGAQTLTTAGTYQRTIPNAAGCDSVITLNLTIVQNQTPTFISASICEGDSFWFNNQWLNTQGSYSANYVSSSPCDSIVNLALTVNPKSDTLVSYLLCEGDSLFFGGAFIYTSGTYFDTLINVFQCDSFVTLNVDFLDLPLVVAGADVVEIFEGDAVNFFVDAASTAQDYLWFFGNGDSSILLNPTVVYPFAGTYEVILIGTADQTCSVSDTLTIEVEAKVGIRDVTVLDNVILYPNPSSDYFYVQFENERAEAATISISDLNGKEIYSSEHMVQDDAILFSSSWMASGMYLVKVQQNQQEKVFKLIIVR